MCPVVQLLFPLLSFSFTPEPTAVGWVTPLTLLLPRSPMILYTQWTPLIFHNLFATFTQDVQSPCFVFTIPISFSSRAHCLTTFPRLRLPLNGTMWLNCWLVESEKWLCHFWAWPLQLHSFLHVYSPFLCRRVFS